MRRIPSCAALILVMVAAGRLLCAADGVAVNWPAIKAKQVQIRDTVLTVAKAMDVNNITEKRVRDVLYGLSSTEFAAAITALETLEKNGGGDDIKPLVKQLTDSQDKAIKILEKLLGIVAMMGQAKSEKEKMKGGDLPNDVKDKLKDLNDKLKSFINDQKKVVNATENLAKTPVDDFTPEQEKDLKQLQATEDQWSKLLKDSHSDLSRVAEQDFSNPSLLKELNQIYNEIEMAKDALSKKATEIAVAHEESGAELAESLTTHIERWLLDEPDRIKWQMEEPLQDYETPMAELPKELQDIVGDLMEKEDDLMDDAEDTSSGWSDSIDKGAGWGTMDGPIQNMSAQGVTGNTLPNNSEIGGRSGEGRTGKSSGEFVGDSAVGKGGRRTPSRLTPDPYEKGQVNDTSKDPAGGATGGGKLSGGGSEGLEGPPPPQVKAKLGALAGRQAELRNKAERIELGFKVMNYPTEQISRTIKIMKDVEDSLRSGRYRNIMRQRSVLLDGLKNTKAFLDGEVNVNVDRSAALPAYLQDEIIDAMGDAPPKGYEDLLKKYYENLSKTK
jgi:hypothetical protein